MPDRTDAVAEQAASRGGVSPDRFTRYDDARRRQIERFRSCKGIFCNAHMGSRDLKKFCPLKEEVRSTLETSIARLGLRARAFDRAIKVARTIADLEAAAYIEVAHIAEAINYRTLDRQP